MVDPVRINASNLVGRQTEPSNVNIKPMNISFNADFSAAATIIFDLGGFNQKDIFGGPVRSLFMDNSSNPNEVGVYVQGSDQYFTVPAYAEGVFSVDAVLNTQIEFTTIGGADDLVTITVYNWEKPPSVWYRYGAVSKDVPLKMQGAQPSGTDMDNPTEFNNPVYVGGAEDGTDILRPLNVDATGRLRVVGAAAGGSVFGPNDIATTPTEAPIFVSGIDNNGDIKALEFNADDEIPVHDQGVIDAIGALDPSATAPDTGNITTVASSLANTVILAANANRKGAMIYNNSSQNLRLALANVDATVSFSLVLPPTSSFTLNNGDYTGVIRGCWEVVNGDARVTEFV